MWHYHAIAISPNSLSNPSALPPSRHARPRHRPLPSHGRPRRGPEEVKEGAHLEVEGCLEQGGEKRSRRCRRFGPGRCCGERCPRRQGHATGPSVRVPRADASRHHRHRQHGLIGGKPAHASGIVAPVNNAAGIRVPS